MSISFRTIKENRFFRKYILNKYMILLPVAVISLAVTMYRAFHIENISIYVVPTDSKKKVELAVKLFHNGYGEDIYSNPLGVDKKYRVKITDNRNCIGEVIDSQLNMFKSNDDICLQEKGKTIEISKTYFVHGGMFRIERIKEFKSNNVDYIFVYSNNKIVKFKSSSDVIYVDFEVFKKFNKIKAKYALVFTIILCFLVGFFLFHWDMIYRQARIHKLAYSTVLFMLTFYYIILFPGIYRMDIVVSAANTSRIYGWYSYFYSVLMNILYSWSYSSVVVVGMLLCGTTLLLPISILQKEKLYIPIYIFLFLLSPVLIISVYGFQRLCTTYMFFLCFISCIYTCIQKKHRLNFYIINISIIIYISLVLMRTEYIVFGILFIFIFKYVKIKDIYKLIPSFVISIVILTVIYSAMYKDKSSGYTVRYRNISLCSMINPYIKNDKDNKLHAYYKEGKIHGPQLGKVSSEDYEYALKFFIKNTFDNPLPFVVSRFTSFFTAALNPVTGSGLDKDLFSRMKHSSHNRATFSFFLMPENYYPFGKNIYRKLTNFITYNKPFYKNGIFISAILIFFIFPYLFRKNNTLLLLNICEIIKIFFTIGFSPASYRIYYFDLVLWSMLAIYLYILTPKSGESS